MSAAVMVFVRVVPPHQPPYDDELDPAYLASLPTGSEQLPFERAALGTALAAAGTVLPRSPLRPDPAPWARAFIQAALETLSGRRPVAQLQRRASPGVLAGLARAGTRAAASGPQPLVMVRSVHVSEPVDGVAEVCAVISRREEGRTRFRAVAARLETHNDTWRCVLFQVG